MTKALIRLNNINSKVSNSSNSDSCNSYRHSDEVNKFLVRTDFVCEQSSISLKRLLSLVGEFKLYTEGRLNNGHLWVEYHRLNEILHSNNNGKSCNTFEWKEAGDE